MPEIVLATLNAKYIHAAFGLRYLLANLGDLRSRACILEFDLNQKPADVVEALLAPHPQVIGLGVYVWNAALSAQVADLLKRVAPEVILVLGGPEVSYETTAQPISQTADYIITGEADLRFPELCRELLSGQRPAAKIIAADLPSLDRVCLPYDLYNDNDVASRIVYVEASRGCPFTCEFCLSSLEIPVRSFPLEPFLAAMDRLLQRGVRHFKFVDRTFNLNLNTSKTILEFFLARYQPGLFFHFEMIPDRLPEELRALISRFPPGALQFEVGIQTFNPDVSTRIKRRQNYAKLEDNFRYLRDHTGVHIHADLIAGLPGETLESFARGFDQLIALRPQEIQVGILKRLRGTPIIRHDQEWEMAYSPFPPYELLKNKTLSFAEMQRLRRFARHWDLFGNSGNFVESTPLLWQGRSSPFAAFLAFSQWLFTQLGRNHSIALNQLGELLFTYLTGIRQLAAPLVAASIYRDYQRVGRSDKPDILRPHLPAAIAATPGKARAALKRQSRHLAAAAPAGE